MGADSQLSVKVAFQNVTSDRLYSVARANMKLTHFIYLADQFNMQSLASMFRCERSYLNAYLEEMLTHHKIYNAICVHD